MKLDMDNRFKLLLSW